MNKNDFQYNKTNFLFLKLTLNNYKNLRKKSEPIVLNFLLI